jgi:hypothetical protein
MPAAMHECDLLLTGKAWRASAEIVPAATNPLSKCSTRGANNETKFSVFLCCIERATLSSLHDNNLIIYVRINDISQFLLREEQAFLET